MRVAVRRGRTRERLHSRARERALVARSERRAAIERQPQREHAALAHFACNGDAAAQQAREFTRNRQAEAAAAVLATRRSIGLLERFENHLELVGGNADAGIAHVDTQHVVVRRRDRQRDLAMRRELDRIRQQIAQDLRDTLAVADHRIRHARQAVEYETQVLRARQWLEEFFERLQRCVDGNCLQFDVHLPASTFERSRMSLINTSKSLFDAWIVSA